MLGRIRSFFKRGFEGFSSDVAKWVVKGLLILAVIIVAWLVGFELPASARDAHGEVAWDKLCTWAVHGVKALFLDVGVYAVARPIRAFLLASFFVVLAVLIFLIIRYWRQFSERINDLLKLNDLVGRVGLFGFAQDARPGSEFDEWDNLIGQIKDPENRILYILGATGWDTFGSKNSPLHEVLHDFKGNIKIILLDPDSRFLVNRAKSIRVNEKTYKNQIKKSIKMLKGLKQKGGFVDLSLYDSPPNWKFILSARFSWVQRYWRDEHVADTPVYLLYATDDLKGLYHAFFDDFDRIWQLSKQVDLTVA